MPTYRFVQLDVFTDKSFAGNPLAVFPEAEGLSDERMMQIAREMNLSETVFVLEPKSESRSAGAESKVLRRLRIFTPTRELPFAGHPIVGTWNALAREGVVPLPDGGNGWTRIYHEVGVGILPVEIEFKDSRPIQVVMTQGKFNTLAEIDDVHERAELARALGRFPEDLDDSLVPLVVSCSQERPSRGARLEHMLGSLLRPIIFRRTRQLAARAVRSEPTWSITARCRLSRMKADIDS
jgi:trans-2,3-dihydro-3-hydroxyanthranilate isomerase